MMQRTLYAAAKKVYSPCLAELPACCLSTAPQLADPVTTCRTSESSPLNHRSHHEARYYTIPQETYEQLFQHGGIPRTYNNQVKTFHEACLMVRKPAIEIIKYLKATDFSHPAIRYVLYGKQGTGKTLTLAHLIHYAYTAGWMIIHLPDVSRLSRNFKEVASSATKPGMVDHPLDAVKLLQHFKLQNEKQLQTLNLQTQGEYVWSKREITEKGSPLSLLIDHGINRGKYACDVLDTLYKELKMYSDNGRCKTMVLIDSMNSFFYNRTLVKREDKSVVVPSKFTIAQAVLNITKNDWKNGAIIMTVGTQAVGSDKRDSYLPRYLLEKEGFEHLDPFVPVVVENYNEKEIESCLDYYTECMWLQHENAKTELGRKELAFLSGRNPVRLMNICASI